MENKQVPLVSIICVTYNHEHFIRKTLEGFIKQKTNFTFEVVVADDYSTDATRKILQEYTKKYPQIIKPLLRKINIGAERNFLDVVSQVQSQYAAICEGDDYWTDPLKLQKQVDFLQSHPDFSVCFHPVQVEYADGSRQPEIFPSPEHRFNKTVLELDDLLIHNFIQTNSVMYRWRKDTADVFPENILPGDWYLHLLHAQKGKIGFIDEIMAVYVRHPGGVWWDGYADLTKHYIRNGIKELECRHKIYTNITNSSKDFLYNRFFPFLKVVFFIFYTERRCVELQEIQKKYINDSFDVDFIAKVLKFDDVDVNAKVQIFTARNDEAFCEQNSVIIQNDGNNVFTHNFTAGCRRIRIDFGNIPSVLSLLQITVYDKSGNILWDFVADSAKMSKIANLQFANTRDGILAFCLTTDPHIILPLFEAEKAPASILIRSVKAEPLSIWSLVAEKDSVIAEKDSVIAEKDSVIAEITAQLINTQNAYSAVVNSKIWRMTKPMRVLFDYIKKLYKILIKVKSLGIKESLKRIKSRLTRKENEQIVFFLDNLFVTHNRSMNSEEVISYFVHYDVNNIISVNDCLYVKKLSEISSEIIFISNSHLNGNEVKKIEPYTEKIIIRKNVGYDFSAWRDAVLQYSPSNYKYAIFANNSCFGPFLNLYTVFCYMDKQGSDFWGITEKKKGTHPQGFTYNNHLQSYFLCFTNKVLNNKVFIDFWKNVIDYVNVIDVIKNYETKLTSLLVNQGFTYASLIPDLHENTFNNAGDIVFERPIELIQHGSPFLKKKSLHFYEYGVIEKKIRNITTYFDEIENFSNEKYQYSNKIIDIIVPVYNGFEYLEALLTDILIKTDITYNLFIINDASSDRRVGTLLLSFKEKYGEKLQIITNEKNLGFLKTVNIGLSKTVNDVVLLNTDIRLPHRWASRLLYYIFTNDTVASVTPFSNAATIFSLPTIGDNTLPSETVFETVDNSICYINPKNLPLFEFPTGVGFCMAMSKRAINDVGFFDEIFNKGYGEENDWCMKALQKGYQNVLCPNLFVYHKHGGTFSKIEKNELLEKNSKILLSRYPDYNTLVQKSFSEPYMEFRKIVCLFYYNVVVEKTILFFDHSLGGGAEYYFFNRVAEIKDELLVLRFQHLQNSGQFSLSFYYMDFTETTIFSSIAQALNLLEFLNIKEIIINNLFGYPNVDEILQFIQRQKNVRNLSVRVLGHDFGTICPSYNLLDYSGSYCNFHEKQESKKCSYCFQKLKETENIVGQYINPNSVADIVQWQKMWKLFFYHFVDVLEVFSENSKDIFLNSYPDMVSKILVRPHFVPSLREVSIQPHKTINIAVIGVLSFSKGREIVFEMARLLPSFLVKSVKLFLVGFTDVTKVEGLTILGKYNRADLPSVIEENNIDIVFIPSICPETFSYTTSEAILMDLPVACFNLGAPAERISKYDKGLIISKIDAQTALAEIIDFVERTQT